MNKVIENYIGRSVYIKLGSMKFMKKKYTLMIMILAIAVVLAACGEPKDKQLKNEISSSLDKIFEGKEEIESIEITDRYTKEDSKEIEVFCRVDSNDGEVKFEKYFVAIYRKYEKNGWVLDELKEDKKNEWISKPLKGISESKLRDLLIGRNILIEEDNWNVTLSNLNSISIKDQKTNLEAGEDEVSVALVIEDEVENAYGELKVKCVYDNGWQVETITGDETFVTEMKPEKELKVTNNDLLSLIEGQKFEYGMPKNGWITNTSLYTISINNDEISDFSVENQVSSSKGTLQTYDCQCILSKSNVTFKLAIQIMYKYLAGEWIALPIVITPTCESLDIVGEWRGVYYDTPYGGKVTLSISEIDEYGNIKGVYSFFPDVTDRYTRQGSYNVSGKIDMETMRINMTAGDWIENSGDRLALNDITAILYVERSVIEGKGHRSYLFEVAR